MNLLLLSSIPSENWTTSPTFLFGILIVGALLTAGVGLMTFTLYVDDYWKDEDFRKQLRWGRKQPQ